MIRNLLRHPLPLISVVLLGLLLQVAEAQEWSRFRGPNGSGIGEAKLPATWTESDYRWNVELPGLGHSCPVLWGDKLFLTSADSDSGDRFVLCYQASDGKLLWKQTFDADPIKKHNKNSFATSTPCCDAERVYVAWSLPDRLMMTALDHEGKAVWEQQLGKYKSGHGFGTSPVVYGDMIILANDQDGPSSLLALNRETGEIQWQVERNSKRTTYSTPCVYRGPDGNDQLIFTEWIHGITSIDPADGSTNWEVDVFGDETERAIGSPLVAGDLVIGTCGFVTAKKHVVAVRPTDAKAAVEIFRIETAVPHVPTALVYENLLFLWSDQGIVTCVDSQTGQIHWKKRVGGNYSGSPVLADGKLIALSEEGEAVVLAASEEYVELGRVDLGSPCYSTPAVAQGLLYIRTTKELLALGDR